MRLLKSGNLTKFLLVTLVVLIICEVSSAKRNKGDKHDKKPGKGQHQKRRHVYKKFNKKSQKFGEESNQNIKSVQKLMSQGTEFNKAVALVAENLPESCTVTSKSCDAQSKYRTSDGACNNLKRPFWGAAFTFMERLTPAAYSDGFNAPRGGFSSILPNARLISTTIHPDLIQPDPNLTNMIPQVGQFVDHDLTFAPENDYECCGKDKGHVDCLIIPIPANDTFYSQPNVRQTCLAFTRSTPFCFPSHGGIREQMNSLTAFLDGSQVYGSDAEREKHLRSFQGGRLRTSLDGNVVLLPTVEEIKAQYGPDVLDGIMGEFAAGDDRVNEMPALTVLHLLLVREHNRLADQIKAIRPTFSDEQIYQNARRLLVAQWQKIVYGEYLPIILGSNVMARYNLNIYPVQFSTYDESMNPTIIQSFATAAYRFGHTLINGLIRLMRDVVQVSSYQIRDGFFNSSQIKSYNGEGYDLILGGLMQQNAQTYDRFVTEDLTNFVLRQPEDNFGSDLLARNIQRGRDHAVSPYNAFRRICGLSGLTTWDQVPPEIPPETWQKLRSLYNSPLDIDLFPGGLSELPLTGAVTGPTFNCIKAIQFQRIKSGDRFFFTHSGQTGSFTLDQISKITARTLGDIICQNSLTIKRTPANVFRPVSASNPWLDCTDNFNRKFLNVADFV